MTRLLITLALVTGIALGSVALFSPHSYACGSSDKGSTTEDTTGGGDSQGTQS